MYMYGIWIWVEQRNQCANKTSPIGLPIGSSWQIHVGVIFWYPPKTNMTMEKQPFEDVFPIENGDFPASHLSFQGCNWLVSTIHLGPTRFLRWLPQHPREKYTNQTLRNKHLHESSTNRMFAFQGSRLKVLVDGCPGSRKWSDSNGEVGSMGYDSPILINGVY